MKKAEFDSTDAQFGPTIIGALTGKLQTSHPIHACVPIDPPASNASTIALVMRSGPNSTVCSFVQKVTLLLLFLSFSTTTTPTVA